MAYHSNGGYSEDERESRSGGDDRPDSDLSDKPIYLLEHLATFTVNKESGIVYPADGMRRLLQLEKTTGIWSQKMQLCLDNQWVLIMDYETGNVIERFPASLIQEPTAFTSNDPMEMYNNILVFIVGGGSGLRSEMHIFQSQSISAVHLVEDLKSLRTGQSLPPHTRDAQHHSQQQPSALKASMSSHHRELQREQQRDHYSRDTLRGEGLESAGNETDSELGGLNDETSSTSSDKYERDVTVLNHCFDDIEKFIARLQHAAAASRELERRRRNRKSKKKDPGEGLLTLRTRPPHEKEFIDIFAKFKLSFNLLAKLKAHIHDPNAPELVHFLFTPLALIVEASTDTYYESHLPASVINPLLTRDAITLLINCVTSKETELWRSLGDSWIVPREQWKGHVGSYHPVFFDGWSPDYPVIDELEHPLTPTNVKRRIEADYSFGAGGNSANDGATGGDYDLDGVNSVSEKYPYQRGEPVERNAAERNVFKDISARSDISLDSIERNGGVADRHHPSAATMERGMGNMNGKGPSGNQAAAHNAVIQQLVSGMHNLNPVQVHATEPETTRRSSSEEPNLDAWLDNLQSRGAKIVQVTYPRTANNDKELSVVRGEFLEILDDTRKWWKARNSRGQVAHVPHTIVTPYSYNENGGNGGDFYASQNYSKMSRQGSQETGSPSTPNANDWVRTKHTGKKGEFRYF